MDRKLLDYLPPVLRGVVEMQAINEANEPEIAIAWDALALVLANQFLETADACGVNVWEKELKIRPKDTDTLLARKARIKALWTAKLPYTIAWLKNWLDGICGPAGHTESVTDYTLNVSLDYSALVRADIIPAELLKMLLEYIPANLILLAGLSIKQEPFLNTPGSLRLHRFKVSMAFSHIRRPWIRFNGEESFDGGILFDQTPAGIRLPRIGVRIRFTELCRRAVRFDGEVSFDGSILFDQTISSTGISSFGMLARLSHKLALSGPNVRFSAQRIPEKPGRAGIPRMTVTAALPRHKVQTGGTVTMDNWRGLAGDIAFDGNYKFDAYLVKEEL